MHPSPAAAASPAPSQRSARPWGNEGGFTVIEVMVAATILIVGLVGLVGLLDISARTSSLSRIRQAANSLARDTLENARGLAYTSLTPTGIATAEASEISGATASGSTLSVTRAGYSFSVSFTACSLDDAIDGYGAHATPPSSGGSWCPDVASGGTTDSNPDDYKRVSAVVTETGTRNAPSVQQTALIYNPGTTLPAVSCLTTSGGSCPGGSTTVNRLLAATLTFSVTTTSVPYEIEWTVDGNGPGSSGLPTGASDPFTVSTTSSSFTWKVPSNPGAYTISAVALDASGNVGNPTSIVVTVT